MIPLYPEKLPEKINSVDKFPFSFTAGKRIKTELESQMSQIDSRINKIVDHFVINDMPIAHYILKVTRDKSDLKKLSKAIDRLADLVTAQDEISSKINVIKTLESDPIWFTCSFSDYSDEIDNDINSILDNR